MPLEEKGKLTYPSFNPFLNGAAKVIKCFQKKDPDKPNFQSEPIKPKPNITSQLKKMSPISRGHSLLSLVVFTSVQFQYS
jgi:hypothetical protein